MEVKHPPSFKQSNTQRDLVISPFGATALEMVEVARCAEENGFNGVWTYDHMTGAMLDRGRSHDAFAILGAIALATQRVRVGPLVANMMNRHPVQLAVAMSTLQSLSQGRAVLGIGAGPAPGSRFAVEHEAIGTHLLDRPARIRRLIETIALIRLVWAGGETFRGEFFTVEGLRFGLGDDRTAPVIIGAGSRATVDVALSHADGVNLVPNRLRGDLLGVIDRLGPPGFETSLHVDFDSNHPLGGAVEVEGTRSVGRIVLAMSAPFDLDALTRIGDRLDVRS